jgi:hypothetical protein
MRRFDRRQTMIVVVVWLVMVAAGFVKLYYSAPVSSAEQDQISAFHDGYSR